MESTKGNIAYLEKVLAYSVFISWIFLFINAFLPQIQMFFLNGRVLLPNIVWKFVFLISFLGLFLIRRKTFPKKILVACFIFVVYHFFHAIYLYVSGFPLKYILFANNSYYFFVYAFFFLPSVSGILNKERLIYVIKVIFIPLLILGLFQLFLNSPLIPTESCNKVFKVFSWDFYGKVRPFSFFSNPGYFAFALLFFVFLVFDYILQKNFFIILISIVSFYLVLMSHTRTIYLIMFFSLIAFTFYLCRKKIFLFEKVFFYMPLLNAVFGVFIIFLLYYIGFAVSYKMGENPYSKIEIISRNINSVYNSVRDLNKSDVKFDNFGDLSNSCKNFRYFNFKHLPKHLPITETPKILKPDSFFMRIVEWKEFSKLVFRDFKSFLFGTGYIQNDRVSVFKDLIVDNFYLNVTLFSGFIGLIIILYLLYQMWMFLVNVQNMSLSYYGVLSLLSTFLLSGSLGMSLVDYLVIVVFLFFIIPDNVFEKV